MTDKPAPTESGVTPAPSDAHELIRQAREAAGMPLDALSLALKVPVKRLEALEAGRYDELPDLTFARALAMSVCRHLQVDVQTVLGRMPSAHAPNLGGKDAVVGDAMYATHEGLALSPVSVLRRPPFLVALALVLAAALLYSLPAPTTAPPPVTSVEPPVIPTPPQPEPVSPAPVLEPVPTPTTSTPSAEKEMALQALAPAAPPVSKVALRLSAQDETWAQVIRPDGTVLLSRMLKAGDVVNLGSAPPYTVVLGRASVAQVLVRGQAIALAPHTRNDVARYEVK